MKMAMFAFFHLYKSKYLEKLLTEKDTNDPVMPEVVKWVVHEGYIFKINLYFEKLVSTADSCVP